MVSSLAAAVAASRPRKWSGAHQSFRLLCSRCTNTCALGSEPRNAARKKQHAHGNEDGLVRARDAGSNDPSLRSRLLSRYAPLAIKQVRTRRTTSFRTAVATTTEAALPRADTTGFLLALRKTSSCRITKSTTCLGRKSVRDRRDWHPGCSASLQRKCFLLAFDGSEAP